MVHTGQIELSTKGFTDIIDITGEVQGIVRDSGVNNGMVCVFCKGSTGGVTTIEYEDGVVNDLRRTIERLAPQGEHYQHDARWGDGNGFSHVRAALMKPSVTVPVVDGAMVLGTWQQIIFMDFDNRPRDRKLVIQVIGE